MLILDTIRLSQGTRILFETSGALMVHPGQKVGLTGNNGTGKSSLFAAILGHLAPDKGSIEMPKNWHIAHMAQEICAHNLPAHAFVLAGDAAYADVVTALAHESDPGRLAALHSRFDDLDGYSAPARASVIMAGLGFGAFDEARQVSDFSGGWQMRLNLARTLMSRAPLILLDEPTNHLDLDAILWLEDYLSALDATLIVISHDQRFLDAVTAHTLHIEGGKLVLYTGNYTTFVKKRTQALVAAAAQNAKDVARRAHLQRFIDRMGAKASKAKQAQSRIKALKKMGEEVALQDTGAFCFEFYPPKESASPLVVLDKADLGYATPILKGVTLSIHEDTRLGILGPNGAGKSTLIRALVGALDPLSGTRRAHDKLHLGYFNQHQMDALDDDQSPLGHLQRLDADMGQRTSDDLLRAFVGGFGFGGERMDAQVGHFSGGERARLVLALLVYSRPNLLILDEPTNHLDLQMRAALSHALQEFSGALVLVSHDRALIEQTCDGLILVLDGAVGVFDGDVDDYARYIIEQKRKHKMPRANAIPTPADAPLSKVDQRRANAITRQKTAPLRKAIERKGADLDACSTRLSELEEHLADPNLYQDANKAHLLELLDAQATTKAKKTALEDEIMGLMLKLEVLET